MQLRSPTVREDPRTFSLSFVAALRVPPQAKKGTGKFLRRRAMGIPAALFLAAQFRRDFEPLDFRRDSVLAASGGVGFHSHHRCVGTDPMCSSARNFWRQCHHQLNGRMFGKFSAAVEEYASHTDVLGSTLMFHALLRSHRDCKM